jgi:hypothetical protein
MIDLSKDAINNDYTDWPVAILGMGSAESAYEQNRENTRTYTFNILVLQKVDNLSQNATDVEDLKDAMLLEFDNDPTLIGNNGSSTANGGMMATSSPTVSHSSPDKTYVVFLVTIKAKAVIELTFNY